jgi:hypothetical protein
MTNKCMFIFIPVSPEVNLILNMLNQGVYLARIIGNQQRISRFLLNKRYRYPKSASPYINNTKLWAKIYEDASSGFSL